MKKLGKIIVSFLLVASLTHFSAYATTSFTADKSTVHVGDTFEASFSISEVAAWNVRISADGPVEECSFADADVTDDALNQPKTFAATCRATGLGDITISLSGDYTTADGTTTDLSETLIVNVVEASPDTTDETEPGADDETASDDDDPGSSSSATPDTGSFNGKSDGIKIDQVLMLIGCIVLGSISALLILSKILKRKH